MEIVGIDRLNGELGKVPRFGEGIYPLPGLPGGVREVRLVGTHPGLHGPLSAALLPVIGHGLGRVKGLKGWKEKYDDREES